MALEWKGKTELAISIQITNYKIAIAEVWEKLGKGKLHFFLAHNGNIEKVLNEIKEL